MTRRSSAVLVAALLLLELGCGGWIWAREAAWRTRLLVAVPDDVPRARELMAYALPEGERGYRAHCQGCHGQELQGNPAAGIPSLVDSDWLYGSGRVIQFERVVLYGVRSGLPR